MKRVLRRFRPSLLAWPLLAVVTSPVESYDLLRDVNVQQVLHRQQAISNEPPFAAAENHLQISWKEDKVNLGEFVTSARRRSLLCFGAYAGDLNTLEYAQQLRYYLPILEKECNIDQFGIIINGPPEAAHLFCEAVDLPIHHHHHQQQQHVNVFVDPTGHAGRAFGANRGWFADQPVLHPYFKLFCMMPWASLPSVLDGYAGHPTLAKPWIQDALAVGQMKGRWPCFGLELEDNNAATADIIEKQIALCSIRKNNFDNLPWVGRNWARRPLELATLRLQNLVGFTLPHWKHVMPDNDEALRHGILTQQAACLVYDTSTQRPCYEWRDEGNCHVADFQDMITQLRYVEEVPSPSSSNGSSWSSSSV